MTSSYALYRPNHQIKKKKKCPKSNFDKNRHQILLGTVDSPNKHMELIKQKSNEFILHTLITMIPKGK